MSLCPVTGKVRHRTEHAARLALLDCVMARNRGREDRREHDVYLCPKCKGWHLTSMIQPRRSKKAPSS
jgi:hypothetical protein